MENSDNKDFDNVFIIIIKRNNISITFIINKKKANIKLSLKLRNENKITIFKILFKASQKQEINGLIIRRIFNLIEFDPIKYISIRIFNSKLINEIKGKIINNLYEKSKLIIQGYNNEKKEIILI